MGHGYGKAHRHPACGARDMARPDGRDARYRGTPAATGCKELPPSTTTWTPAAGSTSRSASIKNIDRGIGHSTPTVLFTDVPIDAGGTFSTGSTGYRVQGGFYGTGHVEAAGIFEEANIIGAFGAKRQ